MQVIQSKNKLSTKLLYILPIIGAILFIILYMVGHIGNAIHNSYAEESYMNSDDNSRFVLSSERSLSIAVSSALVDLALVPSASGVFASTADGSSPLTITVSTNNPTGYNLNMTTTTTNLTRTAPLSGQTPVIQTLSSSGSFTADNFETNAWGFSLDGTNFEAISLSRQINQTIKEANSSTTDLTFGVKLNNEIPSGSYNATLTFIATTNPLEANFDTAFDAAGKTQVSYNGQSYYKMQDMSGFICSMVATPTDTTSAESTQLIDTRDNKIYWVSKLKDGNCWMTQNLDLDLKSSVALTNDTTDLHSVTTWTPLRSTIDSTSYGSITTCSSQSGSGTGCWGQTNTGFASGWTNDENTPYSDNPGYRYMTFTDRADTNPAWYSNGDTFANCTTQDTTCGGQGHYMIGNYYNFAAANATNSVESTVGHTVTDSDANFVMPNSICPKGWRMPIDQTTNNEFNTLLAAYNITGTGAFEFNFQGLNEVRRDPLYFVRSGYVDGNTLRNAGTSSDVWSSTISSSTSGYYLRFRGADIDPANSDSRLYGFPVRCLARTDLTIEDAVYMQDINAEMKQNTAIGTETQVLDKRDGKTYWIAKLADGNVWMTQNLDLDLDSSVTLTNDTTDLNSVASWTPLRSTIDSTSYGAITTCSSETDPDTGCWWETNMGFSSTSGTDLWKDDGNTPYSDDPGYRYMTFLDIDSENDYWYSNGDAFMNCSTQDTICGGQGHYMIGNYYNFAAANATNNIETTLGGSTNIVENIVMPDSICPKGWRLPIEQTTNSEFSAMLSVYNIYGIDAVQFNYQGLNKVRRSPLYFVRPGGIGTGALLDAGTSGTLWSSTVWSSSGGYSLRFDGKKISPVGRNSFYFGFSVRCLLR